MSKNCMHLFLTFLVPRPLHSSRKNLASATAGASACQKIACIFAKILSILELFHLHPVEIWRALPRGHLRVKKMINCIHVIFEICAILRPFHPPRKFGERYRGGTCVLKNCIRFISNFFAFPRPSTHPVKIWQALPRGHLRVKKLHTFSSEKFWQSSSFSTSTP